MIRVELIHGPRKAVIAAMAWLDAVLPPGAEARAATLLRLAQDAGIAATTLRRAKTRQRVESWRASVRVGGFWLWRRPRSLGASER